VTAKLLHWAAAVADKSPSVEQEWGLFDVVLAADCLFFRDFHEALLQLLPRLLRPPHGSVLLLQPRRGDSLELFLHKMTQRGELQLVAMDLDYCPEISEQRQKLSGMEGYNEDIHLPVLLHLQLQKK